MDIISLLKEDHRTVEALFLKVKNLQSPAARTEIYAQIRTELIAHMDAEEKVLYSCLQQLKQMKGEAGHAEKEHAKVRDLLAKGDFLEAGSDEWEAVVKEIIMQVKHHVKDEESEMFPEMKKFLSDKQLARMGDEVREVKEAFHKAS